MNRVILHSDLNGFYASVACFLNPSLRGLPVAVAGDPASRHGIILAKNEQAKAFGIKTGEAIWQARAKCADLMVVKPEYHQYKRFSNLARQIYLEYTPQVEPFGIDEAWLDITAMGNIQVGERVAEELRHRMRQELGLTLSIGVSYNKIFAKLGSDYKKPDAVTVFSQENYREKIFPLPAQDLLYVGKSTRKKLNDCCIYTIGDLAQADLSFLLKKFGKMGQTLHDFSNGLDDSPVALYSDCQAPKSIGNSATTPHDLSNEDEVRALLWTLCESVARRLRAQNLCAHIVSISVRDVNLQTFSKQCKLENATCLAREIYDAATALFCKSYRWQTNIRSMGVQAGELEVEVKEGAQLDFSGDVLRKQRMRRLEHTLDDMQGRFGTQVIRRGAQLMDKEIMEIDPKDDHVIHPVGYKF